MANNDIDQQSTSTIYDLPSALSIFLKGAINSIYYKKNLAKLNFYQTPWDNN